MKVFGTIVALSLLLSGCVLGGNPQYPMGGFIFEDVKGPNHVVPGASAGSKKGESCASTILGVVAFGEASVDKARRAGNISAVTHVDYSSFNVLGVYRKVCALVAGV